MSVILNTIEDYIAFYETIPEDRWCERQFVNKDNQRCAAGHLCIEYKPRLGYDSPLEGKLNYQRLANLIWDRVRELRITGKLRTDEHVSIVNANDDRDYRFRQSTPKQRVIAALKYLL